MSDLISLCHVRFVQPEVSDDDLCQILQLTLLW